MMGGGSGASEAGGRQQLLSAHQHAQYQDPRHQQRWASDRDKQMTALTRSSSSSSGGGGSSSVARAMSPSMARVQNRRRAQSYSVASSRGALRPSVSEPSTARDPMSGRSGGSAGLSSPRSAGTDPVEDANAHVARAGRTRALSETGRQLLVGVYNRSLFNTPLVPLSPRPAGMPMSPRSPPTEPARMPQDPISMPSMNLDENNKTQLKQHQSQRESAAARQAAASKSRKMRAAIVKSPKKKPPANYFAAMMSDEEEGDTSDGEDGIIELPHRISSNGSGDAFFGNPRGSHASAVGKIDESVIGESEAEVSGWETVSTVKKRDDFARPRGPPQRPRHRSPSPQRRYQQHRSDSFDSLDENDLYDLQAPTFASRQVGGAKKAMQFKAATKRGVAVDKRNRQRYGG